MTGLALLLGAGVLGTVAFHMVRPRVHELRVSLSRFLPDPPGGLPPRQRFRVSVPEATVPLALRLLIAALVVSAVAGLWPASTPAGGGTALRVVLDVSGSMSVQDDGDRANRLDAARAVVEAAIKPLRAGDEGADPMCVEVLTAGADVDQAVVASGPGLADHLSRALKNVVVEPGGVPAARLGDALARDPDPSCAARLALVVTDRPRLATVEDRFAGEVLWHRVGASRWNAAALGAHRTGGGLSNRPRKVVAALRSYGNAPGALTADVVGPNGESAAVPLHPDATRHGGWLAKFPARVPGTYEVKVSPGGAYGGDDRIRITLPPEADVALDWNLPTFSRPPGLGQAAGADRILVTPLDALNGRLPHRRTVAVYPGWARGGKPREIGPFRQIDALLEGLDFDVFEANAPTPTTDMPEETTAVLRPSSAPAGTGWVAIRDVPRAAIVPAPQRGAGRDIEAMSLLLFLNAIRWVADTDGQPALDTVWLDHDGRVVPNAAFESDTRVQPGRSPDYANLTLNAPAYPPAAAGTEEFRRRFAGWLLVAALCVLGLERVVGLVWRRRETG